MTTPSWHTVVVIPICDTNWNKTLTVTLRNYVPLLPKSLLAFLAASKPLAIESTEMDDLSPLDEVVT